MEIEGPRGGGKVKIIGIFLTSFKHSSRTELTGFVFAVIVVVVVVALPVVVV